VRVWHIQHLMMPRIVISDEKGEASALLVRDVLVRSNRIRVACLSSSDLIRFFHRTIYGKLNPVYFCILFGFRKEDGCIVYSVIIDSNRLCWKTDDVVLET
jgi:hypothetical protein